jgi:hypothetical protein
MIDGEVPHGSAYKYLPASAHSLWDKAATAALISVFPILISGLFFGLKLVSASMMASGNIELMVTRYPYDKRQDAETNPTPGNQVAEPVHGLDMLAVNMEIQVNENWTIRLDKGVITASNCIFKGIKYEEPKEEPYKTLLKYRHDLSFFPLMLDDSKEILHREISLHMAPKDKISFSGHLIVPRDTTCTVEASVEYAQVSWFTTGLFYQSTIVPPGDDLEEKETDNDAKKAGNRF